SRPFIEVDMATVIALQSFDHYGKCRRGETFPVSDHHAKALVRAGLVAIKGSEVDPAKGAGARSSASPVAPASPQTTSSKSKRGGKQKRAAASSSQTPASE